MKKILSIFSLILISTVAQARISGGGYLFNINTNYDQVKTESEPSGATSEGTQTVHDIKLGMIGDSLYLGAILTSRSDQSPGLEDETGSATGVSAGYFFESGFYFMAHYYISAKYGTLEEGTGYQFDLAYLMMVSQKFHVGVELSSRSIKYTEDTSNAALESYTLNETFPMLTLGFIF